MKVRRVRDLESQPFDSAADLMEARRGRRTPVLGRSRDKPFHNLNDIAQLAFTTLQSFWTGIEQQMLYGANRGFNLSASFQERSGRFFFGNHRQLALAPTQCGVDDSLAQGSGIYLVLPRLHESAEALHMVRPFGVPRGLR